MKHFLVSIVVLVVLAGLYYIYDEYYEPSCPPPRNPDKFPAPWKENQVPHGDLGRLGIKYAKPILGDDDSMNGSIVGGFFKGIDVYPSEAAAQYYKAHLVQFLKSNKALPWWNMEPGELLCKNK